jgi:hypothetical protein
MSDPSSDPLASLRRGNSDLYKVPPHARKTSFPERIVKGVRGPCSIIFTATFISKEPIQTSALNHPSTEKDVIACGGWGDKIIEGKIPDFETTRFPPSLSPSAACVAGRVSWSSL